MKTKSKCGFTFVELLVVVAVAFVVLALIALPALARSKTRSPAAGCLSNLRQLMTGWQMYADDNRGVFMPNAPLGAVVTKSWCSASIGWGNIPANTNVSLMLSALMGKYVNSNVTVFRCPGDVVPSLNGYRLRSYSMNEQIGPPSAAYSYGGSQNYSGLHTYSKEADVTCPQPKDLFVFCDEHPGSEDDGYLQVPAANSGVFPNVPASYLDGGCGFSFADGHGEIHKWRGTTLLIPVVYGVAFNNLVSSVTDPDWRWLESKAGCP